MDTVVQRLHRALAEAVASRRGGDVESQPVTVAEIYQELAPYRTVRSGVGFEMNADYEHALLRLLSGEDGLVRLEPEEARSHLARELATPNPDVTLFRRYAACDVWLTVPVGDFPDIGGLSLQSEEAWRTPGWLDDAALRVEGPTEIPTYRTWTEPEPEPQAQPDPPAAAPAPEPRAKVEAAPPKAAASSAPQAQGKAAPAGSRAGGGAPSAQPDRARETPKAAAAPTQPDMEREMPAARPAAGSAGCAFCGGVLPPERAVRYCPFCGVDQQLRPCGRCGEVLEAGWRYCVNCGAPATVPAA